MQHRPLYKASMGELGTTPDALERQLERILDMCGRWKAIVLLDEADIFLENRSGPDASSSGIGRSVGQKARGSRASEQAGGRG